MALMHATCVALAGVGVLIRGKPGSGKSDLALRLIDGGAELVADDYCETVARGNQLIVTAPSAIVGKLEVRGYGILTLAARDEATAGLVVDLKPKHEIVRMPELIPCTIEGITLAQIDVD